MVGGYASRCPGLPPVWFSALLFFCSLRLLSVSVCPAVCSCGCGLSAAHDFRKGLCCSCFSLFFQASLPQAFVPLCLFLFCACCLCFCLFFWICFCLCLFCCPLLLSSAAVLCLPSARAAVFPCWISPAFPAHGAPFLWGDGCPALTGAACCGSAPGLIAGKRKDGPAHGAPLWISL